MNAKIVGGIVAVLVIAGGAYALTAKKAESPSETPSSTPASTTKPEPTAPSSPMSLNNILASGQGKKCTFVDADSSGTLYAGSGKARVDLVSKTGNNSMIIEGNTTYSWQVGQTTGLKLTVDPSKSTQSGSNKSTGVDTDKQLNYDCSSWTPDSSMLTPPSNVTFQDLGSLLDQLPDSMR